MKHIALFGAGKSSHVLINYLIENADAQDWTIYIGDMDTSELQKRIPSTSRIHFFQFNIQDENTLTPILEKIDVAISMVPAMYHMNIAVLCLQYNKHLITPSYISEDMQSLHEAAEEKGLIFLNEMGLDPGIDHMSAMKIIHSIHARGCEISSFKSYCGGLIAPSSDNNPWNYKFTWNPRNVVLAGQGKGGIKYLSKGKFKYIPYYNLFKNAQTISIAKYGNFDGYPNRDSLKYRSIYGLDHIQTMLRGTLRRSGFCSAWDIFVQLGMTDDTYVLDIDKNTSCSDFLNCFIQCESSGDIRANLAQQLKLDLNDVRLDKLAWLDIFNPHVIIDAVGSPAQILQAILERKLKLEPEDKIGAYVP
ncbi:MAG: saccharopine dehydrogenase NADP-binding domain-containing protein [Bacteroidetes bacterium]|nr:saccharopine dehydrogenase NADP-binding domain-containing protein [Bacteroidota bacterium]